MEPTQQLSTNYTLADLCLTNYDLSAPNLPSDQPMVDNLKYLADDLELLNSAIGPFQLLSGFRTKELQLKLVAAGEPATTRLSFHETGRAVDITPTTMDLETYFGMILADESIRSRFAEIAIKPSQNSIHLAVNVPGDTRTPKITGLTTGLTYASLPPDQIQSYIDQVTPGETEEITYEGDEPAKSGSLVWLLGGAALIAVWFVTIKK